MIVLLCVLAGLLFLALALFGIIPLTVGIVVGIVLVVVGLALYFGPSRTLP